MFIMLQVRESSLMAITGCLESESEMTTHQNIEFRCSGYKKNIIYFPKMSVIDEIMKKINYCSYAFYNDI